MSKKKPSYKISKSLNDYLISYNRKIIIPIFYEDLKRFSGSVSVYNNKEIDVYRRNLQLAYLDRISYIMNEEQGSIPSWARGRVTSVKVSQSDIRTIAVGQLLELKKDIKKYKNKSDKMTEMHLDMAMNKINKILVGKPI